MLFTSLDTEGGLVICACSRRKLLDSSGCAIRIHKRMPYLPGKCLVLLLLQALWTAIPALTGSSLWAETSHVCQGGMTPTEDTRGPRRGCQERGHTQHPRSRDVTVLLKWKRLFPFPQFLLGRSGGGGLGRRGRERRRRGISVKFTKWKQAGNVNSTGEKTVPWQ